MVVYRITEAFFLGAAAAVGTVLNNISDQRKALVIDFAAVPFLDSTAANTIAGVARKPSRNGIAVYITGASPTVRRALLTHGTRPPLARLVSTIDKAMAAVAAKSERVAV